MANQSQKQPRVRKRIRGGTANQTYFPPPESEALDLAASLMRTDGFEASNTDIPEIRKNVHIPRPPTETSDRTLIDEQQVVRVEALMLKGFTDIGQLCAMLGVQDRRQMERYVRRVHARWDMGGSKINMAVARGKALMRIRDMQQQYWVLIQNMGDKDPRAKIVALNSLLTCQQHEERLMGLTDKTISDLNNRSADNPAVMRMRQQDKLTDLAKRMGQLLSERRKSLDGEIMSPDDPDPSDYDDMDMIA